MAARKPQKDTVPVPLYVALLGSGLLAGFLGGALATYNTFDSEQEATTKIQLEEVGWSAATNGPSTCTLTVNEGQEIYHCNSFATIDSLTFGALKLTREGGIEWSDGTQVREIDYAAEKFMEHARERAQEQGLCEEADKETEESLPDNPTTYWFSTH